MSPKWGFREQMERKQQKTQKPWICNTFHKKHLFFKVQKHTRFTKTLENASKKGSWHKGDPPGAIFHDFPSLLELPGGPEMSLKRPKEESENKVKKKVLSPKEPKRTLGGGQTQNLRNGLPIWLVLLYLSIYLSPSLSLSLSLSLSPSLSIHIYIYIYIYIITKMILKQNPVYCPHQQR